LASGANPFFKVAPRSHMDKSIIPS
jgi:hypothetical protein